ncbi:MAG: hypothetical protein HYY93_05155 [Planctomycetes bacterium]|nr:hypothetical protein [Planctomycetota bacterium]
MPFSDAERTMVAHYFRAKLLAERQKVDAARQVKEGKEDFLLVDTRHREAFLEAHIPGAINVTLEGIEDRLSKLPRDQELVTYCWHRT